MNKIENLEGEVWRDIEGYEGLYQVSNKGRVKSLPRKMGWGKGYIKEEVILKQIKHKDGYLFVGLCKENNTKIRPVHRLVAEAFIHNPDNLPIINHRDEKPINNCVENLEWCTHKYNSNYGTCIERRVEKQSKQVLQFDLNGNFIKEFKSVNDVERTLGYCISAISKSCNGIYRQAYGYIWKFKE